MWWFQNKFQEKVILIAKWVWVHRNTKPRSSMRPWTLSGTNQCSLLSKIYSRTFSVWRCMIATCSHLMVSLTFASQALWKSTEKYIGYKDKSRFNIGGHKGIQACIFSINDYIYMLPSFLATLYSQDVTYHTATLRSMRLTHTSFIYSSNRFKWICKLPW